MKITPSTLPRRIAEIDGMDRTALLDLWREVQGAPPPKHLSVSFMRKALIYEIQCRALGGAKIRVARKLDRRVPGRAGAQASASALAQDAAPVLPPALPVGAVLIREWNGRTWRVTVTTQGFDLNGQSWRSLSAIARHITGAHWSGPRFFGLTGAAGRTAAAASPGQSGRSGRSAA